MGGCLFQIDDETGGRNVIAYTSRTLRPAELRYNTTEEELLSVINSLRQWRVFILGRQLTIINDHKALSFIQSCRLLNGRLARWAMFLQDYDFEWQHCKGSENVVADALSRFPIKGKGDKDIPEVVELHIAIIQHEST